jgi:hypothetical protein
LILRQAQRFGVEAGSEACAVVGPDAAELDAKASKEAQSVKEKAQAGSAFFVGQDFRVGQARVVIDRRMQAFPTDSPGE